MGKKVREYKSGDFIFAKVKGYPAWPARVQKPNGKKYFVYFYGTGETANLPPNMIFDYAENKEKFLNKSVKRKDFNDGVRQIDHDFANNVPLEQVIGALADVEPAPADDTMNDSANDTVDDSAIADTTADETMDETANSTAVNDGPVDDSDETGALVIDEGKQKGRKSTLKTPATPKPAKEAKGRGRPKKEEPKEVEVEKEEEKKDEEIVSRSGRKIRPKRYMDEQTEENATLPSPAPKKRRGASPTVEKEKPEPKEKPQDKNLRAYNTVQLSELRELKEPFKSADPEREHILMTYLPSGAYCGVKLFQSRPTSFKNEASRLAWDKQAGSNAITLKRQLEKGQITPQSISAQLVMDLNVTDEQKAMLDKDRDLEIKKSRLHFLKTEIKLIELDAKIKTCLSLEKADTELCLKLIDEILELDLDALMLLKHPTCMETVKRMRVYVGNAPSWEMSESEALTFSKRALVIRNKADALFITMKDLFDVPEGLSFWEYFNERVAQFKACTAELHADKLLEMVHEPIEMSQPSCHTMKAAIDAANEDDAVEPEDAAQKKKATPAKGRKEKVNNTPSKTPLKRQSSRKQQQEEKEKEPEKPAEEEKQPEANDKDTEKTDADETPKDHDETEKINDAEKTNDVETEEADKEVEKVNDQSEKTDEKETEADEKDKGDSEKVEDSPKDKESNSKEKLDEAKSKPDSSKEKSEEKEEDKEKAKDSKKGKDEKNSNSDKSKAKEKSSSDAKNSNNAKNSKDDIKNAKDDAKNSKDSKDKDAKNVKAGDKRKEKKDEKEKSEEKEKVDVDEPRAKRSRESKKTDPPPRSPAKRKSKS